VTAQIATILYGKQGIEERKWAPAEAESIRWVCTLCWRLRSLHPCWGPHPLRRCSELHPLQHLLVPAQQLNYCIMHPLLAVHTWEGTLMM
jgi:hypothetical protein